MPSLTQGCLVMPVSSADDRSRWTRLAEPPEDTKCRFTVRLAHPRQVFATSTAAPLLGRPWLWPTGAPRAWSIPGTRWKALPARARPRVSRATVAATEGSSRSSRAQVGVSFLAVFESKGKVPYSSDPLKRPLHLERPMRRCVGCWLPHSCARSVFGQQARPHAASLGSDADGGGSMP